MGINTLDITKRIMQQNNIVPTKRFGQNFLIDDEVLNGIAVKSEITKDDLVIEIGPGIGNLTEYLLDRTGFAILVEIDRKMIDVINDRFENRDNYLLLNEDVLKVDLDNIINEVEEKNKVKYKNVKVIANLPYYITTPIIFKLLQDSKRVSEIVVMVQKEVANRMVANFKTKDYGILTLMVEYLSSAKIEIDVPRDCFIPAPNVDSSVISLKKGKKYELDERKEKLLFDLIHKAFSQRRKKMINSLFSNSFGNKSKEELENIIQKCDLSLNSRAEELELNDYIKIINEL